MSIKIYDYMKCAIILGTRPEIIKMSPIIRSCQKIGIDFVLVHSGQHYTPYMDEIFFQELGLPKPDYNLGLGNLPYSVQVGKLINQIGLVLKKINPNIVLVQGDTITVLAGALAANKLGLKIGHVEAGLRSFDATMPEEVNRTIVDHISDWLFAPTELSRQNLLNEGVEDSKILVTGNTIVDVVKQSQSRIIEANAKISQLGLDRKKYFLFTLHRAENVDSPLRLKNIFLGLDLILKNFPEYKIIFPTHPRTKKRILEYGIKFDLGVREIDPVGYFEMLALENGSALIITDSGGIQEEAVSLKVPLVTVRDNTERPETIMCGYNVLVPGVKPADMVSAVKKMLHANPEWKDLYGDGEAGKKIIKFLREQFI